MPEIPPHPWSGDNALLWDKLTISGKEVPGRAYVTAKRKNKWDEKKTKGAHGGGRTFTGADNAQSTIEIKLLTDEEHEAFKADILPMIEPTPGKTKPDALPVNHPVYTARKVSHVTVDEVDGPDVKSGLTIYKVDVTEFRETDSKNATGAAKGGPVRLSAGCAGLKAQLEQLARELQAALEENARAHFAMQAISEEQSDVWLQEANDALAENEVLQFEEIKARKLIVDTTIAIQSLQEQMAQVGAEMSRLGCNNQPPSSNPQVTGEA